MVQLLTDGTREQYQKATQVIYYNERPFSEIMRSDTPMNTANRWSFDAKLDFVAYLTAATRSVIGKLRDELLKADASLRDSIDTALAPIPNEPDPENDPMAFRAFLAEEWKRNFFGFRTERTDTMNRYVVAYALLWKAIIGDVARVCNSASRILTKIANEVVVVLFGSYAGNPLLNPPFDLTGDQPTVTSRILLELRRVCIAIHNSACRLRDVMGRYKGIFRAGSDTNIVPPFTEVDHNEAELGKRELAIQLRDERDRLTDQLFTNTRKLCIILDSKPFRYAGPITLEEGSEKAAISAIQTRLIALSKSEDMQALITDVNMPFGLGLSSADEMNTKYPLPGKTTLKLPIVLWLRHVFYGELLDNRNTEYERTTAFIRFSVAIYESPYAVYIDDYISSTGATNMLAETLRVSKLSESQKQQVLEFGAMQIELDGIQGVISGPNVSTEQKEVAASLTPFTYLELDAFLETCENLYKDDHARLALVNVAKEASDEIQDFIRLVDSDIEEITKKDPTDYSFGNSDTLSILASRCTRKKDRDMLIKQLDKYGLDRHTPKLQALSSNLTAKIADVFVLYVWTTMDILEDIANNLNGGIISSMAGPPSPRGEDDNGGVDDAQLKTFNMYRRALRNVENVWQQSLADGVRNASDESFAIIDPSGSMSTVVLREKVQNDTLAYLAFIAESGGPLFKKLNELPGNAARVNKVIEQMKTISNMQNLKNGVTVAASSAKIAAENIAFAAISQQWYFQIGGMAVLAALSPLSILASVMIRGSLDQQSIITPDLLSFDSGGLTEALKTLSFTKFGPFFRYVLEFITARYADIAADTEPAELITLVTIMGISALYFFKDVLWPFLQSAGGSLYRYISSSGSRNTTVIPNIIANGVLSMATGGLSAAAGTEKQNVQAAAAAAAGVGAAAISSGISLAVAVGVAALGPFAAMMMHYTEVAAQLSELEAVTGLATAFFDGVVNSAVLIRLALVGSAVLLYKSRFPATAVAKVSSFLVWQTGIDARVIDDADPSEIAKMRLLSKQGTYLATQSIFAPTGIPRSGPTAVLDRVYEDGPNLFTNNLDSYVTNAIYGLGVHAVYAMGVCGYDFMGTGYNYSLFSMAIAAGSLVATNYSREQTENIILKTTGAASFVPAERPPLPDLTGGGKRR